MKVVLSLFLLLLTGGSLCAQIVGSDPHIHEFVYVDREPEPINMGEVRKAIGYPVKALKAGIEGKIYCRVLVNEQGEYVKHRITRYAHPVLNEAVNEQIHLLKFYPAKRDQKALKYWVNVPIDFQIDASSAKAAKRQMRNTMIGMSGHVSKRRTIEALEHGLSMLKTGQYDQAELSFSKSIRYNPHKNKEDHPFQGVLLEAFYQRARSAIYQTKWEMALHDLTEAAGVAITCEYSDPRTAELIPRIYLERGNAWNAMGKPMKAISDFNKVLVDYQDPALRMVALIRRGYAHSLLGHHQQAFTDIQAAIELSPKAPEPYLYKALVLIELDGKQEACSNLKQSLALGLSGQAASLAQQLLNNQCGYDPKELR
ncbi:energy transducer TonB [Pontibacter sp. G13]|uniref:energy transducer TonB n=1 Tax=Pontibacter sp. G13 TaxID=3074898 RepID=UPI00288AC607|nr:energy transducer TonB [Pontibacter sp. G13]WNJ17770.1 energy transducer TonB [Pontibacter sp. G13]